MIHSMTAFGSARVDTAQGTLAVEIRSVNSRFLDLYFKLPEELRYLEATLREHLAGALGRGKVEVRASFVRQDQADTCQLDAQSLTMVAAQFAAARRVIPDLAAPRLIELLNWPGQRGTGAFDGEAWSAACVTAAQDALSQLQAARAREGEQLAEMMRACADEATAVLKRVQTHLPIMLHEHRDRLGGKLRDTLLVAFPSGFAHISGAELSERLAQEATLFALRIDLAEEITRLRSHLQELRASGLNGQARASKAELREAAPASDWTFYSKK
jgi:uncharacterized protein (TIGR00255 family)